MADQATLPTDPDDLELALAQQALDDEQNGNGTQGGQSTQEGNQRQQTEEEEAANALPAPAGAAAPAPQQGGQGQDGGDRQQPQAEPPAVPYVRFRQATQLARHTKEQLDYEKGRNDALAAELERYRTSGGQPGEGQQGQQEAPKSPEQIIDEANQAILESARKFDAGEITLSEQKQLELDAQRAINAASRPEPSQSVVPQTSLSDQRLLEEHAAGLDNQYPALSLFTPEQLNIFADQQRAAQAALGKPYADGPAGLMKMREDVCRYADYVARSEGMTIPAARQAVAPQARTPAQQQLSPEAQARLNKLQLQGNLPPNPANMGTATDGTDISDAAIEQMTEDQIAALPAAVQNRIFNRG